MLRTVVRFFAIFALFTIAQSAMPSAAADMASNDLGNGLSLIVVSGEFAPNDDKKFANIAVRFSCCRLLPRLLSLLPCRLLFGLSLGPAPNFLFFCLSKCHLNPAPPISSSRFADHRRLRL